MAQRIKILHVLSGLDRGGAELRTLDLLRYVDRGQYEFHFCALSGQPGELNEEVRALGGTVHLLNGSGATRWGLSRSLRSKNGTVPLRCHIDFQRRFLALLREQQFDVVYAHVLNYSGTILRLASKGGVPIRAAMFRSSSDGRRGGPIRWAYRWAMRRRLDRYATHLLAVSEGVMAAVWGRDWRWDRRCQVIYNGLPPTAFTDHDDSQAVRREFGLPQQGPLYVHVGRMRAPKNHLRLLSIFAEVLRREPAARLLLVGRGGNETERQVRQRIEELGLTDSVLVCGQRNDVPRLLHAADALLLPSLWEGLPGAVLEACAAGTPVLASDLPGVLEIAARLPRVRHLPLLADDAEWAEALAELTGESRAVLRRRDARHVFAESEFTIRRCAATHRRVWHASQHEPATAAGVGGVQ